MADVVYPPQQAVTNVEQAINLLYGAVQIMPTSATGNIAVIGGAIESLNGMVTSWMVTGIS